MKTEAPDPLLLSEAICRQLGIIHYHSNIKPLDGNGETEASTETTAVADDNQPVNQLNNQSADISDNPSSVSTCEHPQGPRMTSQQAKK